MYSTDRAIALLGKDYFEWDSKSLIPNRVVSGAAGHSDIADVHEGGGNQREEIILRYCISPCL